MFDFVRNSRLVKIIVVLITASFVYFGFNGLNFSKNQYIVEIGDTRITNYDVKNYLQRNNLSPDEENIKQAYAFLVKRAYLIEGGKKIGIDVSSNQISQAIQSDPVFRDVSGNFNAEAYRNFIQKTYRSELLFEDELKKNITYNYISFFMNNNNILSDYQLLQYLALSATEKEIQQYEFTTEKYRSQVKYSGADLQKFYKEHQNAYKQNKAIKYEYVLLSPESLIKTIKISDASINEYFNNNRGSQPKRMVSQIVFIYPQGKQNDEETKQALKVQAQGILAEVKKHPDQFNYYAQKFSQDLLSAPVGGSLGLIEKNGQYLAPIEDVAFKLGNGQIYDEVVEADDGFYIIKVNAVINGESLAQDRAGIEYYLKYNKAKDQLATLQEKLSTALFNNPTNLTTVSEQELGGNFVQHEDSWLSKEQAQVNGIPSDVTGYLFDPLNIKGKASSDVITVGNTYWIVRVTDGREERTLPFNEVKDKVISNYVSLKAKELALTDAKATLKNLVSGQGTNIAWSAPQKLTLEQAKNNYNPEEFKQFLLANPKINKPDYYLLDSLSQPILVRVNAENFTDVRNQPEKIRAAFQHAKEILSVKEQTAFLSYLQKSIKYKQGNTKLEF